MFFLEANPEERTNDLMGHMLSHLLKTCMQVNVPVVQRYTDGFISD